MQAAVGSKLPEANKTKQILDQISHALINEIR